MMITIYSSFSTCFWDIPKHPANISEISIIYFSKTGKHESFPERRRYRTDFILVPLAGRCTHGACSATETCFSAGRGVKPHSYGGQMRRGTQGYSTQQQTLPALCYPPVQGALPLPLLFLERSLVFGYQSDKTHYDFPVWTKV